MTLEQILADARNVGRNGDGRQALEQRVAQLEQAVAALAQQPPAADQLSPNPLLIDPATGKVTLSRVLNVGDSFTWQSGGVNGIGQLLEQLIAGSPNQWRLLQVSYAPNVGDISQVLLEAQDTSGNINAALSVVQQSTGAGISAAVDASTDGGSVRLIDQAGNSDFCRINRGVSYIAMGSTTLTFAGGAFGSSPLIPVFGIPLTSVVANADQGFGNTAITCTCHLANPGVSTQFQVEGYYPPGGLTANITAYWMAAAA